MTKNNRILRAAFYTIWFVASLLQAYSTPLLEDEAYYWLFSRYIDWGFYEHPPMVAFMIKAGYALFANELGVRLLAAIMNLAAIYIAELLIKPEKPFFYYLIVASIAVIHGLGFLAVPDSALLLFSALFFILYKQYLIQDSYRNAVLIGICTALMLISKYHGILIIGFTILSNTRLLNRRTFWIAVMVSLVILTPHIIWMFANDFPIVRFHLFGRNPVPYRFEFTLNYLLSTLFVFGPLIAPVLLFAGFSLKPRDLFERALKWSFTGIYIFFLLMSFRGRVEAYWTFPALIPALWFGYKFVMRNSVLKRALCFIAPASVILIIASRIFITGAFSSENRYLNVLQKPFANRTEWVNHVGEKAGARPVVFMNSYQDASIYSFYSGKHAMSLNNVMGRKNQFNIWDFENSFRGKEVMVVTNFDVPDFDSIGFSDERIQYAMIGNFQVFPGFTFDVKDFPETAKPGERVNISARLNNPKGYNPSDLAANSAYPTFLTYQFFKGGRLISDNSTEIKVTETMVGNYTTLEIEMPEEAGKYSMHLSLKTGWLPPGINSRKMNIFIQ